MHRKPYLMDNSDVQELHDGYVTDMRIEVMLQCIYDEKWDEPKLDTLYTEIVEEFITPKTPELLVSAAGKSPHLAQGLMFLSLFCFDYDVIHRGSENWPGDFDFLPDAKFAVRVKYPHSEDYTAFTPGHSPGSAAIAALMQYCREQSLHAYNNGGEEYLLN
jgi:hypothetical protein